jgi:hypothetical protein
MKKLIAPLPLFTKQSTNTHVPVKSLLYRIIVALAASLWFSFLPMYLVVLYMAERKFFSYEFLSDDIAGMKTLVVSAAVFLSVVSLYLFGFLLVAKYAASVFQNTGRFGSTRWLTWLCFVISMALHSVFFSTGLSVGKPNLVFDLSVFAFLICAYITSFIGGSLQQNLSNWLPTAMFIGCTAFFPFIYRDATADLLEVALRQFRVGGSIPVKVKKVLDQKLIVEGKLLLITPKNLYITLPENRQKTMTIIRNNDDIRVDLDND